MSWGIRFVAKTKEGAIKEIDKVTFTKENQYGLPSELAAMIKSQITATSLDSSLLLYVESSGHVDSSAGSGTFNVTRIRVVD